MSFGFKERKKRKGIRLKTVTSNANNVIEQLWDSVSHPQDDIQSFYSEVFRVLENNFKENKHYITARFQFLKFVRSYNTQNIGAEYPEPSVPVLLKRTPPTIGESWLENGQRTKQILSCALSYWETTKTFTADETLGWLVFSAIVGGLNDQSGLYSLVKHVVDRQTLSLFGEDNTTICLILDIKDSSYGDDIREGGLFRSFFYMPDPITQIWINRAYQLDQPYKKDLNINLLLEKALGSINIKDLRIAELLRAADYIWALRPNIKLCPTLIRVMQNKTKTCSLSVREFARFKRVYQPVAGALLYQPFDEVLPLEDKPVKTQAGSTAVSDKIINKIKNKLNGPLTQRAAGLTILLKETEHKGAQRLILWLISLTDGKKRKALRNSSVLRYMSSVAHPWISLTTSVDIETFDSEDYEDLYREVIALSKAEAQAYDAGRLMQFHYFMMRECNAPTAKVNYVNHQDICAAKVINPSLFSALIQTVNDDISMSLTDKKTLALIYVLAYRTGLRRSEILGLQLRDVEAVRLENHEVVSFSLLIRANRISTIKSSSAFRRVHLSTLLKPSELQLMLEHWHKQRRLKNNQPNTPLFTLANSNSSIPGHLAYGVLRSALSFIIGEHGYTFHSLRHTALSNLAVVLQSDIDLITYLTDYTPADVTRIKRGLLGTVDNGTDSWNALAQLAGHLTPQQTFQSYIHFAHIQAGWQLCRSNDNISFKVIENLADISERSLYRLQKSYMDKSSKPSTSTAKHLNLQSLTPLLAQELKSHIKSWELIGKDLLKIRKHTAQGSEYCTTTANTSPTEIMFSTLPGHYLNPVSMDEAYFLVKQLEIKRSVEQVAQDYSVPQQLLERWHSKAIELSNLTTRNGRPRLFDYERFEKHIDGLLLPAPLNNTQLTIQSEKFLNNANILFVRQPNELRWFLDTFLEKTQPTRSELYFLSSELNDLKRFLNIAEQLQPVTQWRLRCSSPQKTRELKVRLGLNPKLSIDMQPIPNYTGAAVSLKTQNEKKTLSKAGGLTKYSSAAFKYVCHMLLITLPPKNFNEPVG